MNVSIRALRWTFFASLATWPGGCADYAVTHCPKGATGATFRVVNESGATRYAVRTSALRPAAGPAGFPFRFMAQRGDDWETFLPEIECHTNCDGCHNACFDSCTPVFPEWCAPVIEVMEPGYDQEFAWDGKRTESPFEAFPTCFCAAAGEQVDCLREWRAGRGRYQVELCHAASYTPQDDGCGGDFPRGELGETTCLGVEFDYDLCDRTPVEIRIQ